MQKYRNQIALGLAFTVVVMIVVVVLTSANSLLKQLSSFPIWLLLPVIGLKFINWGLRYLEWHYFLHIIDVKPVMRGQTRPALGTHQPATIRVQDSLILWMASLPFSLSPGKMAEVLKALILKSMTHTPVTRSTPIIFAERLIDGIAVVLILGTTAILMPSAIFATDSLSTGYIRLVMGGITLAMMGVIAVAQFKRAAYLLIDVAGKLPIVSRFQTEIRTLYNSSYELTKLRHLFNTTIFGLGAYFSDCVGFYLILLGLGQTPSTTLFAQATFILGFSVVISAISAMPGGAGGRELTVAVLLSGMVGMEDAAVGAAVLLIGIFQIWFGVIIGIFMGLIFNRRLFPPSLKDEIAAYNNPKQNEATISPYSA